MVAVRLTDEELAALDRLAGDELGRATIVRVVLKDFLTKPEKDQRRFLIQRLFPDQA